MGVKLKQVLMFPFVKFRKKKKKKQAKPLAKPSLSSSSSFSSSKRVGSGGGFYGGFCCTRPRTLESADDSNTSDPNDPNFTYEMLKTLIEKNQFYSKECNPHSFRLQQGLSYFLVDASEFYSNGGQFLVIASLSKNQLEQSVRLCTFGVQDKAQRWRVPEALLNQMFGIDLDAYEEQIGLFFHGFDRGISMN
ncbi:hypothetical protein ES288_D13G254800v1 [Gossypium darwinii]|uniref:Uncharacterized protein n=1 Tax=Gossypium darwinii TaxID=34276 RepID=A0A5D2A3A0_GOSDA|nr:hypothetical protein ES288_D13G254800v1 [Gossypium darwinii]